MTARRPARALPRVLAPALAAGALAALACELPRPTGPRPVARVPLTELRAPADQAGPTSVETVRATLAAHLPAALQPTAGHQQRVWVVQAADGAIHKVARAAAGATQLVELGAATITLADSAGALRLHARTGATVVSSARGVDSDPAGLDSLDAGRINSVEVLQIPPGRVSPDSLSVIWVRLRAPGQTAPPGGSSQLGANTGAGGRIRVDVGGDGVPNGVRTGALDAPLYVLDGRVIGGVSGDSLVSALDPARIASVEVLKGPAAERLYGARGRNGVVQITTKANAGAR